MQNFYTNDKTTQIVLSLLKAHNIRKVIVSPGTTNIALVGSMQNDSFFEMYSSIDERSAAYMACGLAYESGEPVALSCTEATASRNYLSGLTEAYYRKLPILAITGTHGSFESGHLKSQVIDRSKHPADTVRMSINLGKCKDKNDEWDIIVKTNAALLELTRNGGGPVHINLEFRGCSFNAKQLPSIRVIRRYTIDNVLPPLPSGRIAIFIGSHKIWNDEDLKVIDDFCANHNAVVICDKTSAYRGKYRVDYAIIGAQIAYMPKTNIPNLLIHIGEVSGDTYTQNTLKPKNVWRISEDGEIRDTFRHIENVFVMSEKSFFNYYKNKYVESSDEYYKTCKKEYQTIFNKIPEIGFSNIWIAQQLATKIPLGSYIHFSIFNSLRSWNLAPFQDNINYICNVGGFGIDGSMSTVVGASLAHPHDLHFLIIGDLAFFYDMNSLGNRHIGNNLRIMLINNGRGVEFRKYDHACAVFGDDADTFMAAANHYGKQSKTLVKDFVTNLGFHYIAASSKEEFFNVYKEFLSTEMKESSIVFEVFIDYKDDINAVDAFRHIKTDNIIELIKKTKKIAKNILKR